MSDPPLSGALVSSGTGDASFAQQGSLDWVALGRMQYSTSIAVLGRLAKAGIDSLTIAFGQAMCIRLPIGAHGENVLTQAMSNLAAKSSAADLLWFGTGVRHILRELVQTSQGCSLVALCAALTEGHSTAVSALVLYDIAKQIGGPQELQPSLEQWEALVRTAAPAFNTTTFGLRVHQIGKFAPVPDAEPSLKKKIRPINLSPKIPHPSDLARVLLSIGQIVQGSLQSVSVRGGCCCSWIAAWGDFVLGLRVLVRDEHDNVVFANFNPSEAFAQIDVTFMTRTFHDDIICVQTSHIVRSGEDFVRHCFGRQRFVHEHDVTFHAGTLTWNTMLLGSFGSAFVLLTGHGGDDLAERPGPSIRELLGSDMQVWDRALLSRRQIFTRLTAISIIVLFAKSPTISYYDHVQLYLSRVCDIVPELQPFQSEIQNAMEEFLVILGTQSCILDRESSGHPSVIAILVAEYCRYRDRLDSTCGCREHNKSGRARLIQFCLRKIVETMIYVAYMLDRVVLDSPLQPTIYGMHRLYAAAATKQMLNGAEVEINVFEGKNTLDSTDQAAFVRHLTRNMDGGNNSLFGDLAVLFAGQDWDVDLLGSIARSDGKIYCYSRLLEELTDNLRAASQVHVGSGTMEYRSRTYRVLFDRSGQKEREPGYSARHTEIVQSTECLQYDTTSRPITSEIVIDETPTHLYLRHQVSTSSGQFLIVPTLFLERLLEAVAYRCNERIPLAESRRWDVVLRGHQYIKTEGEGLVEEAKNCHMLRPLQGNILGRCVAVSTSRGSIALVKSRQELELFARYWCRDYEERKEVGAGIKYFVLIS
jgi:hypothetical protein